MSAPATAVQTDVLRIVVPGTPPSVNHYKGLNRRTGRWFVRPQARKFAADLAAIAAGRLIRAQRYRVWVEIYLAKGQRLDVDNCGKVILDALQKAGVIDSDAKVVEFKAEKWRDPKCPRTEVVVRAAS